jgi:hypothetical protein
MSGRERWDAPQIRFKPPHQSMRDFWWQDWRMIEIVIVNGGTPNAGDIKALLASGEPPPPVVQAYLARKREAGRPKLASFQLDAAQWRRAEELIAKVDEVRRAEKCTLARALDICGVSERHYWRARKISTRRRKEADAAIRHAARMSGQTVQEFVEEMNAAGEQFEK